jgi:ribose transport system substrate-binding protein
MKASPGIEVLSSNQYGGADVEGAYKRSETLLSRYKGPDGRLAIDGIFCPNESTTFAMLRVLQDNGWAGKVRFVGFDAPTTWSRAARRAHRRPRLQDPVRMGYLGVKTMVAHLQGPAGRDARSTPACTGHRATWTTPEMKELLQPDLSNG